MRVAYTGNPDHQNTRVWLEEMAARGVEPVVICEQEPSWDVEWAQLVITPPRIRGLGLGRLAIARAVTNLCRMHGVELLHSHEVRRHAFWARASGFHPRVITCWGSDVLLLDEKPLGYRLQVRRALASTDAITVGSRHLLQVAVRAGARERNCVLVGWGVDTQAFRPDSAARQRLRREWGFEDRVVVLSTRRLHPLYRVDSILRALAIARNTEPALALVVVADGPEHEELERLAGDLGLQESVVFLGGVWSDEWPSMPDIYAAADVYCSVPLSDGGPLSVLEAMAAAVPVIASDLPVMREWVQETGAGMLWAGGDEAQLAGLILELLPLRAEAGDRGRRYVEGQHCRAEEMDRVRSLYDRLVNRHV